MNGTTAQLLSLITYGNQFLRSGKIKPDYYPNNAAFKFCNRVDFMHINAKPDGAAAESLIAASPIDWFEHLQQNNCLELKIYYHPSAGNEMDTPDHKLAGFVGGGGSWLIESIYPDYSDFWASRWAVTQPDDANRNIWSVDYGRTVAASDTINFSPQIEPTRQALKNTLTDIEAFARQHQLDNWAEIFRQALETLDKPVAFTGFYEELMDVTAYQPAAMQLIQAAMAADVFGGMGSGNDLGFEHQKDNEIYDQLSVQLYDCMNRAIVSGINAGLI